MRRERRTEFNWDRFDYLLIVENENDVLYLNKELRENIVAFRSWAQVEARKNSFSPSNF